MKNIDPSAEQKRLEKNKKISASLKETNAAKKAQEENLGKKMVSFSTPRDALRNTYVGLNPERIRGILDSTRSGYLLEWSDFCDYILEIDSHIRALTSIRVNSVAGRPIVIEPSSDTPEAKAAAAFIKECFANITGFDKTIRHMLMATYKGAACSEIIYRRNDDKGWYEIEEIVPVSLRRIKIRLNPIYSDGQRYQTPVTTGYGRWVYSYWNYGDNSYGEGIDMQEMFPGKFIVHSPGDEDTPHLRGLYRSLAFNFLFKQASISFSMAGAEKNSFPAIYAKVPKGTPEETRFYLANTLNNLANDSSAVVDGDVEIKSIDVSANGGDFFQTLLIYFNSEISKLLLGGTLNAENGTVGSYALGDIHYKNFIDLINSDAKSLSETIREQIVKPLLEYNTHLFGNEMPPIPMISFDTQEKENIKLEPWHIETGFIRVNELRTSLGLQPLGEQEGNEFINAPTQALQNPAMANDSVSGGVALITDGQAFEDAGTAYNGQKKIVEAAVSKEELITPLEIAEIDDYTPVTE